MLVNRTKALKILEEVVEGNEDKVILQCYYADLLDRTKPNCLVGHVLYRLDPEIIDRIDRGYQNGNTLSAIVKDHSNLLGEIRFTGPALKVLNTAQEVQDGRGDTVARNWGRALEVARSA
jgi:hypothetical protein